MRLRLQDLPSTAKGGGLRNCRGEVEEDVLPNSHATAAGSRSKHTSSFRKTAANACCRGNCRQIADVTPNPPQASGDPLEL